MQQDKSVEGFLRLLKMPLHGQNFKIPHVGLAYVQIVFVLIGLTTKR